MNMLSVMRSGALRAGQRRFARTRPDGFHDRMGPETTAVHGAYLLQWIAYGATALMCCNAVSNFEVENPWEHLWAQVPRGGLPHTQMNTARVAARAASSSRRPTPHVPDDPMGIPKDMQALFDAADRARRGTAADASAQPGEDPLSAIINRQGYAVLDGGFSGELEKELGRPLDDVLWTAEGLVGDVDGDGCRAVTRVHQGFARAGADVVIAASYQASVEGFARKGYTAEEANAFLTRSVHLARDAVADASACGGRSGVVVAASVGPYAAVLADGSEYAPKYTTVASVPRLMAFHRDRLAPLLAGCPQYLACETIPCAVEAAVLTSLLQELEGCPPAWLSFTVAPGGALPSGEALFAAAALVLCHDRSRRVRAIGVNCLAPADTPGALRALARARTSANRLDVHLLCYPNRGNTWDGEEKVFRNDGTGNTPFAAAAKEWRALGARAIGGCCQCGADVVAAVREAMEEVA